MWIIAGIYFTGIGMGVLIGVVITIFLIIGGSNEK
jgi:hypothetical protein